MPPRNKRPDLNGVLALRKPLRWSSAKACARVRSITGGAKVGHAGTLDPLATGVLVLCLGRATKSIHLIQAAPKTYTATINLQHFTTTDDREGENIPTHGLDPADFLTDPNQPDRRNRQQRTPPDQQAIATLIKEHFTGEVRQRPPNFSAVKVDGQRAYKRARAGDADINLKHRTVRIDAVEILAYQWPELELKINCSKGTYIRSIARDLGLRLGTGGHLAALHRNAVGDYTDEHAHDPRELTAEDIERHLTPPPLPERIDR